MAKIDKNPSYRNRESFNSFDMWHEIDFSSSTGHILPVMYDLLSPGERIDVQFQLKTRTQPLDAAAFMEVEEVIDVFFVPIEQIYHPFSSLIYGVTDVNSDLFSINANGQFSTLGHVLPYSSMDDLMNYLVNSTTGIERHSSEVPANYQNNSWTEVIRLYDMLNVPVLSLLTRRPGQGGTMVFPDGTQSQNLLCAAAYQKIWMDYYRLGDYSPNDPACYNLDSFYQSPHIDTYNRLEKIFKLRYVPYLSDFYTNIQPSPLFGPGDPNGLGSSQSSITRRINQWLTGLNDVITSIPDTGSQRQGMTSFSASGATSVRGASTNSSAAEIRDIYAYLNPANIRTLFASEKILEITRRAGKHYDKQTLAHFGVDVPTGISGECFFVGHHSQTLQIGDVVSTADAVIPNDDGTADVISPLGKIGGKGYSYHRGDHMRFTAPSHGILMAVMYVRPKVKYLPMSIDRLQQYLYPNDFYNPKLDNLGMQPLFHSNLNLDGETAADNSTIEGWQYRYMELKKKKSIVHGALASSLNYWTLSRNLKSINQHNLYVGAEALNPVMLTNYLGYNPKPGTRADMTYNAVFLRDPLVHSLGINYRKASTMSTFGLSSL